MLYSLYRLHINGASTLLERNCRSKINYNKNNLFEGSFKSYFVEYLSIYVILTTSI